MAGGVISGFSVIKDPNDGDGVGVYSLLLISHISLSSVEMMLYEPIQEH